VLLALIACLIFILVRRRREDESVADIEMDFEGENHDRDEDWEDDSEAGMFSQENALSTSGDNFFSDLDEMGMSVGCGMGEESLLV
jgi:hypothetical protein